MVSNEKNFAAKLLHTGVETDSYNGAVSLGGVESIVSYPVAISHAAIEPHVRQELGIRDGLLRLSVGLEDADDLLADLASAMEE
jgi:cystathionine beta-lyase